MFLKLALHLSVLTWYYDEHQISAEQLSVDSSSTEALCLVKYRTAASTFGIS